MSGQEPLPGRDAELAVLRAAAAAARAGTAAAVVLEGPAGIGKSRLLDAVTVGEEDAGALVLAGGSAAIPGLAGLQSPFAPFVEALEPLTWRAEVPADIRDAAAGWLDDATAAESGLDPAHARRTRFLRLIETLCRRTPVVLAVDDVHWADRSSLALLVQLVRTLRRVPLLVLAAARPADLRTDEPWAATLDHLARLPHVRQLTVRPLPDAEITALVRAGGVTDERRVAEIVRLAAGRPLAATELARAGDGEAVPRTIATSVAQRLAGAPSGARRFVAAVAVLGDDAPHDVVRTLLGDAGPGRDADAATDRAAAQWALDAGLVVATATGYRFEHELDRAAVHDLLYPDERGALHRAAALALQGAPPAATAATGADRAARIAAHWQAAGDISEAASSSAQAARAAAAVAAYPEALAHAERAVALGHHEPQLVLDAADYARWAGVPARGADLVLAAIGRAGEPAARALLWERLGRYRRETGDGDAFAAYARAVEALPRVADPCVVGCVYAGEAALLMTRLRFAEAGAAAERALAALGDADSALRANALNTLGVVNALTGLPDAGLALLESSRDVALAAGAEQEVWRYFGNATFVLQNLGRTAEALDVALAARDRAERGGILRSLAALPVIVNAVAACVDLGRWPAALALVEETLHDELPPATAAHLRLYEAAVRLHRDELDAAERALPAASRLAPADDPVFATRAARLAAELAAARADIDAARGHWHRALDLACRADDPELQVDVVAVAARVEADAALLGRRVDDGATAELELRLDGAVEALKAVDADSVRAEAALARAELRRAGEADDAAEWAEVARLQAAAGRAHQVAYARLREAEAALAARDRAGARRAWSAGTAAAAPLGPAAVARRLAELGRRARLSPDAAAAPADPVGLTRRERQVLALLVHGRSNRQIATRLGMSEKTASVHVSNLMAKLGVTSRASAAAAATRLGLADEAE